MSALWLAMLALTLALAGVFGMVALAIMVGPLLVMHAWIVLRETRA